ncbi:glycosyltransferase family 2 protein [Autumnicola musiva]|uniref:Nucleotide-diphospho-sugar transferase n=1 Tax=Autumnicola musiva TaxID=3075589 RepID=A0ABU3D843_9FLAO|nr:nucleotide-diphospho-sugar transferase [Zunongwangia sp. F117]MDT0677696.1 nucleotide-diphospho-sugar transferase [Zunongwangia sp. F117]
MNVPVLLITFNRPDTTIKVFEKIREAKPTKLFVFSDGPRKDVDGEERLVNECRALIGDAETNWGCDITYLFNSSNMGCANGVNYAISKAFETVDQLIILEDDIIPDPSFFNFCKVMLENYKESEDVMQIAGTRWNDEYSIGADDHFFSTIGHIWGWATWKRAWNKYDFETTDLALFKKQDFLLKLFGDPKISTFWHLAFDEVHGVDYKKTWDYQWQYTLFKEGGLSVVPNVNLTSNIGLEGVHSDGRKTEHHFRPLHRWINTGSNVEVRPNLDFDKYHIKKRFMAKPPMKTRIANRLKRLIKS